MDEALSFALELEQQSDCVAGGQPVAATPTAQGASGLCP
jgi:hypothetical protein